MPYTKPFDFTNGAGNTIDADEVNDNFDTLYSGLNTVESTASGADTLADSLKDAWRPGLRAGGVVNSAGLASGTTYMVPIRSTNTVTQVGATNAPLPSYGSPVTATHYEAGSLNVEGRISAYLAENATSSAVSYTFGLYTVTGIGGASGADPYISAATLVAGSQTPTLSAGGNLTDFDVGSAFSLPAGPTLIVLGVTVSGTTAANSRTALAVELQTRLA